MQLELLVAVVRRVIVTCMTANDIALSGVFVDWRKSANSSRRLLTMLFLHRLAVSHFFYAQLVFIRRGEYRPFVFILSFLIAQKRVYFFFWSDG